MKKSGLFILLVSAFTLAFSQEAVIPATAGQNAQIQQVHKAGLPVGAKLSNSSANPQMKPNAGALTKGGMVNNARQNTSNGTKLPVGKALSSSNQQAPNKLAMNKSLPVQSAPGGKVKYGKRIPAATLPRSNERLPVGAKISATPAVNTSK